MDIDKLRSELEEMEWNALRQRAKVEYGIKLLPEHKRLDVLNMILQKANQYPQAPSVGLPKAEGGVAPGYARITLFEVQGEPDPFYVCINGWSATIPRGIKVDVPHEVLPSLDAMSADFMVKGPDGILARVKHKRAPYQVHEVDDSVSSNRLPFTQARARATEDKRVYERAYKRWPTDMDMRDFLRSGGAEDLRKFKEQEAAAENY